MQNVIKLCEVNSLDTSALTSLHFRHPSASESNSSCLHTVIKDRLINCKTLPDVIYHPYFIW